LPDGHQSVWGSQLTAVLDLNLQIQQGDVSQGLIQNVPLGTSCAYPQSRRDGGKLRGGQRQRQWFDRAQTPSYQTVHAQSLAAFVQSAQSARVSHLR